MGRNNCERNFCGIYFCDFTTLITKMFCKMKKRLLITKKLYDFERKHTKMWYNWQNLFCKTYILEHLIAKARSTKIYFVVNFFFKVTHVVFLYTVYIYFYTQYVYTCIYIKYIYNIIYVFYIYIYYIFIYSKENTIIIPGVDGLTTQSQYLVLMNLTSKVLLSNNYCIPKLYQIINIQQL